MIDAGEVQRRQIGKSPLRPLKLSKHSGWKTACFRGGEKSVTPSGLPLLFVEEGVQVRLPD